MILINITIYGQHHISIIFNPPFRSNPLHTAPKCRHESSTCESHHRFVAPEWLNPGWSHWVHSEILHETMVEPCWCVTRGMKNVWSLGRGPEKQTASWTAKKGGLRETRGAGSSREGRWPSAPFSSRILLLSLPRRLLEHVFPSGYTITLSGWWYTYPSEKYESIGRIIPIYYGKIIQMFQTTSQIMYIYSYYCIYPSILLKDFHGFCDP